MYENIFSHNFILNFFFGFFFLISNVLFTLCVTKNDNIKRFFFFKEYQSIVIYFLIFCIYSVILNISVITGYKNLSTIIYFIFFLQIFYTITNFGHLKSLLHLKFRKDEKFVILVFFSLFLISILPLSDADSMSIYQYIPATIYNEGLDKVDLIQNLEFTLLSNTEILLLLSSIFKSENLGSQLNLITILFFILVKFKNHKDFSLIILSSPLIIYFISAQKLQLFFGMIFLLLFILVNKNLIKKKIELFIFIILLVFYSSGKFSYILFTIPLYIYFFYKNLNHWKHLILYSLISFTIIYFPLLTIKQIYFNNILAPFFDNLLGQGLESYNAFVFSIRNSEGWIADPTNIFVYIRPFISFELSKLSSSLGLIFLLMLFDIKLLKKTIYLPIILIILVLATGQILPRYYFEGFLLLAYYYHPQKFLIKLFIYSQMLAIFFISLVFIYFAYIKYDVVQNKSKYMNKFSYSFFNSKQIKEDRLNGKVLDFSLDRHSIFFDKNVYSSRYLTILNNYNNLDKQNFKSFLKENSFNYVITNSLNQIPKCLMTKKIGYTYRKLAVRNFLRNSNKEKYKILEITENNCNK